MRTFTIVGFCWWAIGCQPTPLGTPEAPPSPESRSHTTVTVIPPSDPQPEDTPEEKVPASTEPLDLNAAQEVLSRQHDALAAKDPVGFCADCRADVFLLGPDANHALNGKKAATDGIAQMMTRQRRRPQLSVKARSIGSEPAANIVWAMEDIEITGGARMIMRSLTLLEHDAGKFRIAAQAWSIPIPHDELLALARSNRVSDVAKIDEDVLADGQGLRKAASAFFATSDVPMPSGRDDTFWSGIAPEERFEGDASIAGQLQAVAARRKRGDLQTVVKGIRARKVGEGGYAVFNVETSERPPSTATSGPTASSTPLTYTARQFQIFVKQRDGYRPVAGIVSVGRPLKK